MGEDGAGHERSRQCTAQPTTTAPAETLRSWARLGLSGPLALGSLPFPDSRLVPIQPHNPASRPVSQVSAELRLHIKNQRRNYQSFFIFEKRYPHSVKRYVTDLS